MIFKVKELFCKKCEKPTRHEYVRNKDTYYWRCEICVNKAVKHPLRIYTPPHVNDKRMKAKFVVYGRNY